MDLNLPTVASELGAVAHRAMTGAGGFDLARQCIAEPGRRQTQALAVVERLDLHGLDVRSGSDALLAAAEVCRVAGSLAFPYPVPAMLARPTSGGDYLAAADGGPVASDGGPSAPDGGRRWVEHGDLPGRWLTVDPTGATHRAEPVATRRNRIVAPFVEPMVQGARTEERSPEGFCLVVTLDCWRILGAVESVHEMTTDHVRQRHQFGRSLADFQGVQFHVADATVAVRGLRQLSRYTAWRLAELGPAALVDVLAFRSFALECAGTVLRIGQLLHGAVGLSDEHDLSVVTRSVQAALRLPTGTSRTDELLVEAIDGGGGDGGFAGLFDGATALDWYRRDVERAVGG